MGEQQLIYVYSNLTSYTYISMLSSPSRIPIQITAPTFSIYFHSPIITYVILTGVKHCTKETLESNKSCSIVFYVIKKNFGRKELAKSDQVINFMLQHLLFSLNFQAQVLLLKKMLQH
jgi:hypothetical protein